MQLFNGLYSQNWSRLYPELSSVSFLFPESFVFRSKTNKCQYKSELNSETILCYYQNTKELDFSDWLDSSYILYSTNPDSIPDSLKNPLAIYRLLLTYSVEGRELIYYDTLVDLPQNILSAADMGFLTYNEDTIYSCYRAYLSSNTLHLFSVEGKYSNTFNIDIIKNEFFDSIAGIEP